MGKKSGVKIDLCIKSCSVNATDLPHALLPVMCFFVILLFSFDLFNAVGERNIKLLEVCFFICLAVHNVAD